MERPIMRNKIFLALPSEVAGPDDLPTAQDLLDTLAAHQDDCVGMAANMIGVRKRIIAFVDGEHLRAMLNPEIVSHGAAYTAVEGCLSLDGETTCTRYRTVKVRYLDLQLREHQELFTGFTAQIVQHEVDHCNGVLV